MDFRLSILKLMLMPLLIIISFSGCKSAIEDPGNKASEKSALESSNKKEDENSYIIVKPLIPIKTSNATENTQSNVVISISDITNIYNDIAYKKKIIKWHAELKQEMQIKQRQEQEQMIKSFESIYGMPFEEFLTMGPEFSNTWNEIDNLQLKYLLANMLYHEPCLLELSNNNDLNIVYDSTLKLGKMYTIAEKNDESNELYEKAINRLEEEWIETHDFEIGKKTSILYIQKGGNLKKMGKNEERIPVYEQAAQIAYEANCIEEFTYAYRLIASTYGDMEGPYQKEKAIEALKKSMELWSSIENPTKAQEVYAYLEIEATQQFIKGCEKGHPFFTGGL